MDVTYKKDINHTYIEFSGEHVQIETFQVQMLLHNLVDGLLNCSLVCLNDEEVWRCECTGLPSLDVYCRTKELNKEDFLWVIHQLLENIQEIQDYLLDVNTLYLLPEYIYIHPQKKRLLCCLVPFYHKDIWSSLKQVLQFLLQYLDPADEGAASVAYGLFRMLSREDCSMELLWSFLYEKEHSWKKRELFEEKELEQSVDIKWGEDAVHTSEKPKEESKTYKNMQHEEKWQKEQERLVEDVPEEEAEGFQRLFSELKDIVFWKKIAYVFPALAAVLLFLYLAFHSWTMSGRMLLICAGMIVGLQIVSLVLYWLWGRQEKEVNPLLEAYASGEMLLEEPLIKTIEEPKTRKKIKSKSEAGKVQKADLVKTLGIPDQKEGNRSYSLNWSEEFEKKLFGNRSYGPLEEDGCTVLLTETKKKNLSLVRMENGSRYELEEGEILIGKSKERAQILLTEATVSRIHALIIKKKEMYYLQDLNSKNGTYINGERLSIRTNYPIKAGDKICIADVAFTLA